MKATGIVRRVDDLGRIVIPKEIRRTLRIREGDPILAADGEEKYHLGAAAPILSQGDLMGCVLLLLGENDSPLQEADQGLVKTAAGFLGKQMEN